jgi:hypothetical protein
LGILGKGMVVSLATDKGVWDAVLANEKIQEFRRAHFTWSLVNTYIAPFLISWPHLSKSHVADIFLFGKSSYFNR